MDETKFRSAQTDLLMDAILHLKDRDEAYHFFEDLCTIAEINKMAQRLEVAVLLRRKETYQTIAEATGASTATISRINRAMMYGQDGYQEILGRLDREGLLGRLPGRTTGKPQDKPTDQDT
ncbi:MAG: hypothetical protein IJ083_15430 [Clostridia bacterium]|nr:hypothetical protein [Clostridia bacterium]